MILLQRGPVSKFVKAGAISPETARKPSTIQATGELDGPIRSGLLVSMGDGRYYVNLEMYRRKRRNAWRLLLVTMIIFVGLIVWLWPPW